MSEAAKLKYLTKTVRFGGKELVLYSIDGMTWSTRRTELQAVKERHEAQRVTFNDIKGVAAEEPEAENSDNQDEDSGEPFEMKVNDDDNGDDSTQQEARPKGRRQAPAADTSRRKMNSKQSSSAKTTQPILPKKKSSPASIKIVASKGKRRAAKAEAHKRSSSPKSKVRVASKSAASAKKARAKKKAA